jgi:hypothetical protein
MNKNILKYAATQLAAGRRFPTNDAYGNFSNSVVLDVTYECDVLDKINFDGVIDDIWAIRSSGFVHPELQ